MSPSADNEGFDVNGNVHVAHGHDVEKVVIAGAGPAGLMLGYVNVLSHIMALLHVSRVDKLRISF